MKAEVGIVLFLTAALALPGMAGCGGIDAAGSPAGAMAIDEQTAPVETGTVVGQLVSLRSQAPVAGARIAIGDRSAVTGTQGTFAVGRVALGEHWLILDDSRHALLGGPLHIRVTEDVNDVGKIVVDTVGAAPPAAPTL